MGANFRHKVESFLLKNWQDKRFFYYVPLPFSYVYKFIAKSKKITQTPHQSKIPVIVVGNIFIGGTGKSPITKSIATYLKNKGLKVGIISRGYGIDIDPKKPRYASPESEIQNLNLFIGDEPSELASVAPIAVGPDRNADIDKLLKENSVIDIIISDDGLQNTSLFRDLEIIVFDDRGVGNGQVLPSGPLREPIERIKKADFVVINSDKPIQIPYALPSQIVNSKMLILGIENLRYGDTFNPDIADSLENPKIAMAGIGNPQKFFNTLKNAGIKIDKFIPLNDHFSYDINYLDDLEKAVYFVTSKDASKIRPLIKDKNLKAMIYCVHVEPEFEPADFLERLYSKVIELKDKK